MTRLNFYERAEKLGHSVAGLQAGNSFSSTIRVFNVDELRKLLDDGALPQERAERELQLFGHVPIQDISDVTDTAIMRRVHAFLYGNADLAQSDRDVIQASFPVDVMTVSAPNFTYDKPTDLGTSLPLIIINYGTVTINDGACVNVHNSKLQFTMDNLIRNGNPPKGFGDFNVFGVDGAPGKPGPDGTNQGKATNGTNGTCSSCGIASTSGKTGDPGATGGNAKPGNPGFDGLPSKAASFTVTTSIKTNGNIVFYTRSGAGGVGGKGGNGGKGGDGGDGGRGAHCSATGSAGGNGGAGGAGGVGGDGGQGGNGVPAEDNVLVYVPAAFIGIVSNASDTANFGDGGAGGTGGGGGTGGSGGSGGPSNPDGSKGGNGGKGGDGGIGPKGTKTGSPASIQIRPI
jgi:hypothetical protein